MGNIGDVLWLDATAQAELIKKGEVTPAELLEAAIARAEEVNPKINAIVTPMYDLARESIKAGLPDGPFHGVPFLVKDLMAACKGVRMTAGSAALKDNVSGEDNTLTVRYRQAGLAIFGRTNLPEFGLMPTTEPALFGPCRNPWNLEHTTGGSSGGSGAAVAAGVVAMAHGNDGGGSIRIPASCCGLFGLKPTRARNPKGPYVGDVMGGFVEEHALTRSVRDSAALLDATSGPEPGDPYYAPPKKRPFLDEVGANPGKLRIAFSAKTIAGVEPHPDCVAAMEDAAKLCQDLGHHVEEATPALKFADQLTNWFTVVWTGGLVSTIELVSMLSGKKPDPADYEPLTWTLYEVGKKFSAGDYLSTVSMLQMMSRQVAAFMADYDIILTPTLGLPPVPLGTFDPPADNPMAAFGKGAEFVPYTPICNVTGQPAMTVPLNWNEAGLPIGSHFVGRFGDEATLFRLAAQLEQARPWAGRRPAL